MSRSRRHQGFTLLELILAMLIAAMLSLTLYATLNTAIKARRTALAAAHAARVGAIPMDVICHDLESAVRPASTENISAFSTQLNLNGPFQGVHKGGVGTETDDLLFYTIAYEPTADPNDPLAEGTRQVEYYLSTDSTPPSLVRKVNRNLLSPTQQNGDVEMLCHNVQGFAVQYFDGQTWQTDWDSTQVGDVLPFAVRITLTLVDPDNVNQQTGQPITRTITRTVPIATAKLATQTQ
jgi:general secretion pathway protein J